MITTWRWLLLNGVLLVGLLAMSTPTAQAVDGSSSTLQLSSASLIPGQSVTLTGLRWTPNTVIQASVCGAGAVNGSVDCAVASSVTLSSGAAGVLNGKLLVVLPPKPCPCVVLVVGAQDGYLRSIPVKIAGAQLAGLPPPKSDTSKIVVVDARLIGSVPLSQWLGLSATRTLALTVRNVGAAPASSIKLVAALGDTPLVNVPLKRLGIGQKRTYDIPVTVPALSVGSLNLDGRVFTFDGQQTGFKVPDSIWPFGLLIAALVLIQMILLAVRNLLRRRHLRSTPLATRAEATEEIRVVESEPAEPVASV